MCKDNTYPLKIIIIFTLCFTFELIFKFNALKNIKISINFTSFEKNSNIFKTSSNRVHKGNNVKSEPLCKPHYTSIPILIKTIKDKQYGTTH